MPEVIVKDLGHVTVDGQTAGSVVDVLHNYGKADGVKAALLAALQKWADDREAAHAAAIDALKAQHEAALQAAQGQAAAAADARVAEIKAQNADALRVAKEGHTAELSKRVQALTAQHAAEVDGYRRQLAHQREQIDALGGTELGQKLAREKRCHCLRETIAEAQAELAAHEAATPAAPVSGA